MADNSTLHKRSRKADKTAAKTTKSFDPAKWPIGRPSKQPGFPLTPHVSGRWMKKIRQKIHYFGEWAVRTNGKLERLPDDGRQAALDLWLLQKDELLAGRTPRAKGDGLTVGDLCNEFLTAKTRRRDAGEITLRSFDEYKQTTDRLVATFGRNRLVDDLASSDFESLRSDMAKQWGPVRLGQRSWQGEIGVQVRLRNRSDR